MTFDAFLYFAALAVWSGIISYLLLFKAVPYLTAKDETPAQPAPHARSHHAPAPRAPRRYYSSHDGFRSFAKGEHLTVEDIVKGLSQK